jgi:hypothetical protein
MSTKTNTTTSETHHPSGSDHLVTGWRLWALLALAHLSVATAGLLVDTSAQLSVAAPAAAAVVATIGSIGCHRGWLVAADGGESA